MATDWVAITEALEERSGGRCEVRSKKCVGRPTVRHHKLRRSKGGEHILEDLLYCCQSCHLYLHDHPAEAYENGWLIRMSANL